MLMKPRDHSKSKGLSPRMSTTSISWLHPSPDPWSIGSRHCRRPPAAAQVRTTWLSQSFDNLLWVCRHCRRTLPEAPPKPAVFFASLSTGYRHCRCPISKTQCPAQVVCVAFCGCQLCRHLCQQKRFTLQACCSTCTAAPPASRRQSICAPTCNRLFCTFRLCC